MRTWTWFSNKTRRLELRLVVTASLTQLCGACSGTLAPPEGDELTPAMAVAEGSINNDGDAVSANQASDGSGAHALGPGGSGSEQGPGTTPEGPATVGTATDPSMIGTDEQVREPGAIDPGSKEMHRLNSREYDNTVSDLFGAPLSVAAGFLNESSNGFDNIAAALGMTRAQYAAYYDAARLLAEQARETPNGEQLMRCQDPSSESSLLSCARAAIESFGARAWRRPLLADEVNSLEQVYLRARDLGLNHEKAMTQVVRALLSSAEFLYRMEFDTAADGARVHALSGHELASRLSYFLWGTMPDDELFAAAAGNLTATEPLVAETQRMLADPRASALVDAFAWQWLGLKDLESHAVLSDSYPEWNEELRASMLEEARLYLAEFLLQPSDWNDFLTARVQFVDDRLAAHYGQSQVRDARERRVDADEHRLGFMGLGAFLTTTSFAHRTSPTLRAKWVLEELLCTTPPPPPPNVDIGDLDAEALANQAASIDNVRERLELHRSDPSCAGCHATLDPLGLSLENFDAIGRYRTHYEGGDEVDASAEMTDGTQLEGLESLANVLQQSDEFWSCSVEKLLTFAMGRGLTPQDRPQLDQLLEAWRRDPSFQNLVRALVTSDTFRMRRAGENK